MTRLSQLSDSQRVRLGWAALVVGSVLLAVAVIVIHYARFPDTELINGVEVPVQVDYFGWIPRGWPVYTAGYVVAFMASQLMLFGAAMIWVANQKMTWARAGFAALLAWIELAMLFGVVPSEWLNLTQGPLEFTNQRIAFIIPSWLVLGNEVEVSYGAIKDLVSGIYNPTMLAVVVVFAYKIQDWGKQPAESKLIQRTSPYGRPLVKGD